MESNITQDPPPTKNPEHGQGQKFEKNADDHMVSMEATQAEFALQQTILIYSCSGLLA